MKKHALLLAVPLAAGFTIYQLTPSEVISTSSLLSKSGDIVDLKERGVAEPIAQNQQKSNSETIDSQELSELSFEVKKKFLPKAHAEYLSSLKQKPVSGREYVPNNANTKTINASDGIIQVNAQRFKLDPDHVPVIEQDEEYIYLQLQHGLTDEVVEQLSSLGVSLDNFIDTNTWLVNVNSEQVDALLQLDAVKALGERAAADKVASGLLNHGYSEFDKASGKVEILVQTYRHEQLEQLIQDLMVENVIKSREDVKIFGNKTITMATELSHIETLVSMERIAWLENAPGEVTLSNVSSAALSGVNVVKESYGLTGSGVTLGIWDGGNVDDHNDFVLGNLTNNDSAAVHWHSTHVAGTMIGSGDGDDAATGMAPGAMLQAYDLVDATLELWDAAQNNEIDISNHSYSTAVGWFKDADGEWDHGENTELFGFYDATAGVWDFIVDESEQLIVKSAGNNRGEIDPDTELLFEADGGDTGYDTIPTFGNAKNIITVGASGDLGLETRNSSGWGPADDGRVKPDIVADGEWVYSTFLANGYARLSGTSMASPVVAGSTALLRERYLQVFDDAPDASMLKAILLHSATDLGNIGPDYQTGWGLLNLESAIEIVDGGTSKLFNHRVSVGSTRTEFFEIEGTETEFRVTAVWTDPARNPGAPTQLVNDIDIRLISPSGVEHFPWVLDQNNPELPAERGDNQVDNIEQVVVLSPESGVWKLEISGDVNHGLGQEVNLVSSVAGDKVEGFDVSFDTGFSWSNNGDVKWLINQNNTTTTNTGPNNGALGSDYYAYMETSDDFASNSGDTAILESPEFDPEGKALSFYYHMHGESIGELKVEAYLPWRHTYRWATLATLTNEHQSEQGDAWAKHIVDLSRYDDVESIQTIKLRIKAVAKGGVRGDIAIDEVRLIDAVNVSGTDTITFEEFFESGFESDSWWSNKGQYDWHWDSETTPTTSTGPSSGSNGSTGYIYFETSSGDADAQGDSAVLQSGYINLSAAHMYVNGYLSFLSFDYHMFGVDTGSLSVQILEENSWKEVWFASGQQHDSSSSAWTSATVSFDRLLGFTKIRFVATAAGGIRGDIALDNIRVSNSWVDHINETYN